MKNLTNQTHGDTKLCCGKPPRLMSGEGFGYALMCTECGKGLFGAFVSDTYQGAAHLWDTRLETTGAPTESGRISKVAIRTLRDMTDAHDVLRNIALVLGVGGYNATDVDAKVFEKKILEGIDMLVKPLTDRIEQLTKASPPEPPSLMEIYREEANEVISTVMCGTTKYSLTRCGVVHVKYLGTTLSDRSTHITAVGLSVQQLFEEDIRNQKLKSLSERNNG